VDERDEQVAEKDPVAPGSPKSGSEAAQSGEDEVDRDRGGPDEKAVEQARKQLSRLRDGE